MDASAVGQGGGYQNYLPLSGIGADGSRTGSSYASRQTAAEKSKTSSPSGQDETRGANSTESGDQTGKNEKADKNTNAGVKKSANRELTADDLKAIAELATIDRRVRAHEAAHIAAGGQYVTGSASFEYQMGPDGKRYAVGGEVSIDTSPEKEPEATIAKMQVVQRAALAPADPSAQDRSVAASAVQKEMEARMELAAKTSENVGGTAKTSPAQDQGSDEKTSVESEYQPARSRSNYGSFPDGSSALDLYA